MTTKPKPKILLLLAAVLALSTFWSRASAQSSPREVALTPGVCARVADGDIVTLEWNPGFSGPVTGLQNFEMSFMREDEMRHPERMLPRLSLTALTRGQQRQPLDRAIVVEPNGFYRMRLWVNAASLAPGIYKPVDAFAAPLVAPDFQGPAPQMTNDPLRFAFCIEISAGERTLRRPPP